MIVFHATKSIREEPTNKPFFGLWPKLAHTALNVKYNCCSYTDTLNSVVITKQLQTYGNSLEWLGFLYPP